MESDSESNLALDNKEVFTDFNEGTEDVQQTQVIVGDDVDPLGIKDSILNNLVSLDSKGDPVSFYLNQQFQWNLRLLSSIFTEHVSQMKEIKREIYGTGNKFNVSQSQTNLKNVSMEMLLDLLNVDEKPPTYLYQKMDIKRLQRDLINLNSKINNYETYLGNEYDCQIWVKMTKVIKTLSSVLMKFLPDYWKLCMHYIEGRYDQDSFSKKKKNETKEENDRAEKCQLIIRQMVELYTILITKILFLDNPLEELSEKTKNKFGDFYANSSDSSSSDDNDDDEEEEDDDNEFTLESQNSLEEKKRKGVIGVNMEQEKEKQNSIIIDTSTTKSILYNPISHMDTIGNAAFAEADKEKGINKSQDNNTNNDGSNEYIKNDNNLVVNTEVNSNESLPPDDKKNYSIFSSPIKLTTLNNINTDSNEDNSINQSINENDKGKCNSKLSLKDGETLFSVNFKKQMIPMECSLFVNSHPLIICYFLSIILKNISNTYNKIRALKYNKEDVILSPLHDLINDLKLRAVELISKNTIEETKTFFKYENWIMDDDIYVNLRLKTSDDNSPFPISTLTNRPMSIISRETGSATYEKSKSEIHEIIEKEELKNPLIGTTNNKSDESNTGENSSIGGIGVLNDSINSELNTVNISSATTMVDHHKKPKKKFDIKNNDIKTLVIMSNIMAFNEVIFPKIKKFYESSFKKLSEEKIDELFESSKFLNSELFESYLKKKLIKIRVIVRNGILYSGFDWYYITVPHEVSPYITKLIIEIVKIHSQITDISRKLQHTMLSEIFLNLVQDLLEAFREIDHYSVAGMLQATLETEVIHQTLTNYEMDKTSDILKQIYQRVERNVILDENTSSEGMTKMLNDVKSKLSQYQEQMSLITSCFTENANK
ncbi:hypothetical protein PIROE2DRAFT_69087 [Piromyces sp. E2]|nr:hypothetical protein PIROE2DRAFT_69087 [Piromyces sp. E2]|eukprot:OUM65484.1 hypothetical protein PIROE2DRAFT_69087 [Piromyces sp. E2]